jgi:hypothetical protein
MFYNNQSTDIWNLSESTFGSPVISIWFSGPWKLANQVWSYWIIDVTKIGPCIVNK